MAYQSASRPFGLRTGSAMPIASMQKQFPTQGSGEPSPFALQTFDAALQELENAQAAFDALLNDLIDGNR
ncbi:hypothetical protein WM00_33200 [Burkholderia cepacia]|nr:hypothetical protein WM00_33200 [Burkholderia cepacia]OUE40242.1 hypothetical protein BZY94_28295 [Burkholderia territorii]